jgi:hypothetical protein
MSAAVTSEKRRRIMPAVIIVEVMAVEVMADGANFGLFVQRWSKQANRLYGRKRP